MATRIESLSDNIYVGAYKNTPCKAYYSNGSSSMRTCKYKVEQFNLTGINSKIIPVFNTKVQSNSLNNFLTATIANDGFDGSFGKAESVFYDEYVVNTPSIGWSDPIHGYSWYNRSEAYANGFHKKEIQNENTHKSIFHFYPNPTKEVIIIETNELDKELVITNLSGQIISQYRINTYKFSINLESLTYGVYFLKLGESVEKLIVQ